MEDKLKNKRYIQKLSTNEIKKLYALNKYLVSLEEKIIDLAQKEDKIMLLHMNNGINNIQDYELKVTIEFYDSEDNLLVEMEENMKSKSLNLKKRTNINDKNNHNTTSFCWKNRELNLQHHCWLLHSLYDDYLLSWEKILTIKMLWFNIKVEHQYQYNFISV